MIPTIDLERERIRKCLGSHPILLLHGPEQTGVVRAVEAILEQYAADEIQETEEMVWGGIHPDLVLYDGRELRAEDARSLRQFATSRPANWNRRFVIISYIHRPHFVVMPILLKLIEEPPDHLSMILTTSSGKRVIPTIMSRSLQLKIRPSEAEEIRGWLSGKGKDDDDLRVKACGGDLSTPENLDLRVLQEWCNAWSDVLVGVDFKKNFLATWTVRLEEASEPTQISCWSLLVDMVAKVLDKNRFWVEVGLIAMEGRNTAQSGFMNKMASDTFLFKVYAISKVVIARGQL